MIFNIHRRLMLIFVAIYVIRVGLFDQVNFCQAVFACFDASRLKSEVEILL